MVTVGTSLIVSGFIPVTGTVEEPEGACVCAGDGVCPPLFPLPIKNTTATITTAMIPTTAAIVTHGLSHGSFLALMSQLHISSAIDFA
jgi:hypothetical protein